MNHRIEPHFEPSGSRFRASSDADVQSLVAALSAARVAIAIGADAPETTRTVREAAIALAAAGDLPAPGRCGDIVVVFDHWAGEPCVGLLDTIAVAVDNATGTLVTRPNPDPRSLADVLAYWGERCGANFVIVLEHFDRNLAAEPLKAANARFTEQLAQAIEAQPQRARFLLVLHSDDERLIQRLSARLTRPCTNLVRLARPAQAPRTQAAPRKEAAPRPLAEDALPRFSAYGDESVDNAATDSMLRSRQARRRKAKLGMLAAAGLVVVAVIAVSVMAVRSRVPDPGALLTHSNEARDESRTVGPAPQAAAPQSPASPVVEPVPAPAKPAEPPAPSAAETVRAAPTQELKVEPVREVPATAAAAADIPAQAPVAETKPEPKSESKPDTQAGDNAPTPVMKAEKAERPAAFRVDAPVGAPVAEKLVRNVPNPERGPMLFIHIRDDAQRAKARELERNLARLGIVVSGIKVDEKGPLRTDLRYFRGGEHDEANYLRTVLGRLGMSPARTTFVSGYESIAVRRHYELWLAPPAAP